MESILSLVLLIAIYSGISIVKTLLSGKDGVEAKPLADEAFPEVELLEPDGPVGQPVVPERREPRSRSRSKDVHAGIDNEQSIAAGQDPGRGAQNGKRFAFNNKSEAKRAVIYSEILNRKYD